MRLAALVAVAWLAGPAAAQEPAGPAPDGSATLRTEAPLPPPAPEPAAPAAPAVRPALDSAWVVSGGTGWGSLVELVDSEMVLVSGLSGTASTRTSRFHVNLRLDREVGRWLSVGVSYAYFAWSRAYASGGTNVGNIDYALQTLLANANVRWVRSDGFELYSGLGIGAGMIRANGTEYGAAYSDRAGGPAFQLRLLGLAGGNERVRAFGELGIGFESMVLAGLAVRI